MNHRAAHENVEYNTGMHQGEVVVAVCLVL